MANEIAKTVFGGAVRVADVQKMAERAAESAAASATGGAPDGSEYLNFSGKQGRFELGQGNEKREIHSDETWVVNIASFQDGWVCWKGGKPQAQRLSNIYSGVPVPQPDFNEFGPFDTNRGEGWFAAKAMILRSLDTDEQGYLKLNSVSGCSAMADLMTEFSERAAEGLAFWPVVQLDKEKFEAKGFVNFKPVFRVIGWLNDAGLETVASGEEYDLDELLVDAVAQEPAPPPAAVPARRRR